MSLRVLALVLVMACGGPQTEANEPQTAKQKQLQEAKATGELDQPTTKWAGWRYQGTRSQCFYVIGRRCFKTEKAACAVAHCKSAKQCTSTGAGPATVACSAK